MSMQTGIPETATTVRRRRSGVPHGAGFWIIAFAFLSEMAFSTIPTPLYALYQQRDGFPTIVVTVIFAAYAVGVVAALLFIGHLSDWFGRRRMILVSLVISLVAAVLFLVWTDVPGLILARFVNGIAVGTLTATATAHLSELGAAARRSPGRSTIVSTFANMGGLALGPLIAGILATWVPSPLIVPYAAFGVLFLILILVVALVPETVERREERPAYRPQRIAIPAAARGTFWAAGAAAFGGFAVFGMFTGLAPTFLAGTLHETSRLLAGVVPFAAFMAGALAQIFTGRLAMRRQIALAVVAMVLGLAGIAVAAPLASLVLFLVGGIVAGAGVGILFRAAIATVAGVAEPRSRGEALAALFLLAYIGLTIPVLGIGAALLAFSQAAVLIVFAIVVAAIVVIAGTRMARSR